MAKKCFRCGSSEKIRNYNYAGFNVLKNGVHAFTYRISPASLPGNPAQDFLCSDCASLLKSVTCSVHGDLSNQAFKWNSPPVCDKCQAELKEITKGCLPINYWMILPLSSVIVKSKKIPKKALFSISKDSWGHVIANDEVVFSESLCRLKFEIESCGSDLLFKVFFLDDPAVFKGELLVERHADFGKLPKGWMDPWKGFVSAKVKAPSPTGPRAVCCVKELFPGDRRFGKKDAVEDLVCLAFDKDKINTFPARKLPGLGCLNSWHLQSSPSMEILNLGFVLENNMPHLVTLTRPSQLTELESLGELARRLPIEKKSNTALNLQFFGGCRTRVRIHPNDHDDEVVLYTTPNSVAIKVVASNETLHFTHGYVYAGCSLLVNENQQHFCLDSVPVAEAIAPKLKHISDLPPGSNRFLFFLLERSGAWKCHALVLSEEGIHADGLAGLTYSRILSTESRDLGQGFTEVILTYAVENSKPAVKRFVAPKGYAHELCKTIETHRMKQTIRDLATVDLYKTYHQVKKQNMLSLLFLNLVLLNRQLNEGITLADFINKLKSLDPEQFFMNKDLYGCSREKLSILCIALPMLKQAYEYLAAYYPYIQFESDMQVFEKTFGVKLADGLRISERRQRTEKIRQRVRQIQSGIQRPLSEIERALYPVEQILETEEMRRRFSARLLRVFPLAAQALLVGTLMVTGVPAGGVSVLAGMIGINVVREVLGEEHGNKEKSAQIKRACESVFSWWKVLIDTLPVIVFETADSIDQENQSTLNRDNQIFSRLPEAEKKLARNRMDEQLKHHTISGTQHLFEEIGGNTGIYYQTLVSELDALVQNAMGQIPNEQLTCLQQPLLMPLGGRK
jgi:hypothetical protein